MKTITLTDPTYAELQTVFTPFPMPIPIPVPTGKKYVLLNCINWSSLNNLQTLDASEFTYFVLLVNSNGVLTGGSISQETKFVSDVHAAGKKATFSIGGGTQNVTAITTAVNTRTVLIQSIYDHIHTFGYDGVTLDIENTNIAPQSMVDFIVALRQKIGVDKIIGCYVQPFQILTVWNRIEQAASSLTWLAPMIYDFPNTVADLKTLVSAWIPKVGLSKLLAGVAVNYDATGVDMTEFPQVLDWINAQGLLGIGIWENTLYIQPYRDILHTKLTI